MTLELQAGGKVAATVHPEGQIYLLPKDQKLQQSDGTHRDLAETQMAILNALPAHIALIDSEGVIVSVNEAWRKFATSNALQGPAFCVGTNYLEVCENAVGDCSREAVVVANGIREVLQGNAKEFALEYPCHSPAEQHWFRLIVTPLREDRRSGAVITHLDITERKQLEARSRLLVDSNVQGVAFWNREGGITEANDAFLNMIQHTREDLKAGRINWVALTPPEYASLDQRALEQIAAKGVSEHYEKEYVLKDGSRIPVLLGAAAYKDNPNAGVCFVLDLSERKRAQERILEQAALLDKTRDAIMVRDLDGKVLFWNKGAERMYGWTRQEALDRKTSDFLYMDPKKFEEINALTINRGEWNGELQHRTSLGAEITIEARWTLILDNQGHPKSVLAINTNITERKKIEQQLLRAQRMESIGTLAGGIAHDLNNILAPILMSIQILKNTATDPEAGRILDTIQTSAKRGADIVRQVLSFARGLESDKIEVQPKHLLKDLESIIKDTFPKDIRQEFSIPNDTWTISGDPTQIHQILLNLCVNARDAMPSGGGLTVNVKNSVLDEHYSAMNLHAKAGRYVQISVTDTGTGMEQSLIDKIFEPFFTTKDLSKGTGLGLSTVMAIVKSHDGVINVYSEPGKGTIFKVYLPAMEFHPDKKEEHEKTVLPMGMGETVLVIDDESSILTITSQTLRTFGYKVLTAIDGAEGIAIYARHQSEISAVLTDMTMPLMDGMATIRALLRINPTVKIIAASGLNGNGGWSKVFEMGVKHTIVKPYTAETLLNILDQILAPRRVTSLVPSTLGIVKLAIPPS